MFDAGLQGLACQSNCLCLSVKTERVDGEMTPDWNFSSFNFPPVTTFSYQSGLTTHTFLKSGAIKKIPTGRCLCALTASGNKSGLGWSKCGMRQLIPPLQLHLLFASLFYSVSFSHNHLCQSVKRFFPIWKAQSMIPGRNAELLPGTGSRCMSWDVCVRVDAWLKVWCMKIH